MAITPDELTRLRQFQAEATQAAEKAGDYQRYLAKRCDHPAEAIKTSSRSYSNGFGGWREREHEYCSVCHMERHWGPKSLWFEYTRGDDD